MLQITLSLKHYKGTDEPHAPSYVTTYLCIFYQKGTYSSVKEIEPSKSGNRNLHAQILNFAHCPDVLF